MREIPLLRFNPPRTVQVDGIDKPAEPGTVSVTPAGAVALPLGIAIIVAVLGAIQPFVSSLMTTRTQAQQQDAKSAEARAAAEIGWLRSVLAIEDKAERAAALKFLLQAHLVKDDGQKTLSQLQPDQIPLIRQTRPAPDTPVGEGKTTPANAGER